MGHEARDGQVQAVRAGGHWRAARAACVALVLAGPLWGEARAQVARVPVAPSALAKPTEIWVAGASKPGTCIDPDRIAGAVVVNPRTVELIMKGGKRWRLMLANACPQLSYYGGFYYQQEKAGKFCAGSDRIMGRAGGECRVSRLVPLVKKKPR